MKFILLAFSILILFSCATSVKENVEDYSEITLTMDTVVVDSGDDIINLKYGIWTNTLSEDNKFLYLWNTGESTLDKINLETLQLEKKIPFEREGPNGVGDYVSWMSFLDENEVLLAGFGTLLNFDMEGKKIRDLDLGKVTFGKVNLEAGDGFDRNPIPLEKGDVIYGYIGNGINSNWTFVKADFKENKVTKIELPGINDLPDYRILLEGDNINSSASPERFLKKAGNRIIISSSAYSTLYVLDLNNDSVYQANYTPKLTPTQKKGEYPEKIESVERFREVMAEIDTEINFQAPVWDEQNRKFYRFSFETIPTDIYKGPLFISAHQRPISKVYLSILDENLTLLGETLLNFKQVPNTVFVRDGKIWYYVNVNDELGFVRMTIEY